MNPDQSYIQGSITFESNAIDQSDTFLQQVVLSLLLKERPYFHFRHLKESDIEFQKAYPFEDIVEGRIMDTLFSSSTLNERIHQRSDFKRIHPKSQFDQLQIKVDYTELNENRKLLQTGTLHLTFDYNDDTDSVAMSILKHEATTHEYNAQTIQSITGMDAIDTFTYDGVERLVWHLNHYYDQRSDLLTHNPLIKAITEYHQTLENPVGYYLSIFSETTPKQVIHTDVDNYIEELFEDHLQTSQTVQHQFLKTMAK